MAAEALPQADVKLFGKWSFDDVEVSTIHRVSVWCGRRGRRLRRSAGAGGGRKREGAKNCAPLRRPPRSSLCCSLWPRSCRARTSARPIVAARRDARRGPRARPIGEVAGAPPPQSTQPPSPPSSSSPSPPRTPPQTTTGQRHRARGLHRGQAQVRGLRAPHRRPVPAPPLPQGAVPDRRAVSPPTPRRRPPPPLPQRARARPRPWPATTDSPPPPPPRQHHHHRPPPQKQQTPTTKPASSTRS